jgi:hypothetical protein
LVVVCLQGHAFNLVCTINRMNENDVSTKMTIDYVKRVILLMKVRGLSTLFIHTTNAIHGRVGSHVTFKSLTSVSTFG